MLDQLFAHQRTPITLVQLAGQIAVSLYHDLCLLYLNIKHYLITSLNQILVLLEQSCEDAHFFLSSVCNVEFCRLRIDRPHPAVIVPRREKARFTIGEEGTLFGRGDSISGT